MVKNKKYGLAIAYYYTDSFSDGKDAVVFVVDKNKDVYRQFKKYAKWAWDKTIKDDDIDDVFLCEEEDDCEGKSYRISVRPKLERTVKNKWRKEHS